MKRGSVQLMDAGAERALLACASIGGAQVLSNLVGLVDEDWFGMASHQPGRGAC